MSRRQRWADLVFRVDRVKRLLSLEHLLLSYAFEGAEDPLQQAASLRLYVTQHRSWFDFKPPF
jgi:hypothetical protein